MINRELIRIKTVQLLYSYLLVENPFTLESQPSAPTKEKRFAFALYLDLLYLMARVARKIDPRNKYPLADTRFISNVLMDDRIKSLGIKYRGDGYPFQGIEDYLAQKIKDSSIYKNFVRAESHLNEENIWKDIFEMILMPDEAVNREISKRENFTLKGVDRMRQIMETTFANFFASGDNIPDALKTLRHSMDKARELYFRLLALPIAITTLREREIDNAQYKLLRTKEDMYPNLRFTDNEFVKFLREDEDVQRGISEYKIDWLAENEAMVKTLLKVITQSSLYQEYLEFPATDFKTDCELWRNLLKNIVFVDEDFLESMEDSSVFWNDDLDVLGTFVLKSIKKLGDKGDETAADSEDFVLPMFKDEEDAEFGAKLFTYVIQNKDKYRQILLEHIDKNQWELERLAFMDLVLVMTALAEILNFPKVPLSVSFNEYIEIAKYYSTPRSGVFINGLLGQLVKSLQNDGLILKTFNK